ncbi:hypothetical protein D3C81_287420 [compost metagenome]
MDYKFIDDLFPTEELMAYYHSHPFPFNLPLIKDRLDLKLKENPDYEVFVPLYYRKLDRLLKDDRSLKVVNPHYLFISNRGNVISNNMVETFQPISVTTNPEGEVIIRVNINNENNTLSLHRALACSFLPVPDHLTAQGLHPKDLEVGHKNANKLDFTLGNLQWTALNEHQNVPPAPIAPELVAELTQN